MHWEHELELVQATQLLEHTEQVPANLFENVPDGQVEIHFPSERKYPEMQAEQEFVSVQDVQKLGHASQLDLSAEA